MPDTKKNKSLVALEHDDIRSKIYTIRGFYVILDRDLASLYDVETGALNRAVNRNIKRFPSDFMFELKLDEFKNLMCQNGISSWGGIRKPPKVFTEIGIATLSGILQSDIAIKANIKIMRAFVDMRRLINSNAQIFQRLDNVEKNLIEYKIDADKKFEKIFDVMEENEIKPKHGIFFDGQVFDAYKFISDIIRKAEESIVIIDNYVDDTVLSLLTKKNANVKVIILTKNISEQIKLDVKKYNTQYSGIEIKEFKESHDRFIILDNKDVYLIGASLKDLGKKWFAFSKIETDSLKLIDKLKNFFILK
jgi:hypothetical protein